MYCMIEMQVSNNIVKSNLDSNVLIDFIRDIKYKFPLNMYS